MFSNAYDVKIKKSVLLAWFAFCFALIFYITIGHAALEGELNFQFYADSLTYEKLYNANYFSDIGDMVGFGGNYIGPMLVLEIFGGNRFLILLFNCFVFLLSVKLIVGIPSFRSLFFLLLVFLNPITFFSLITVNKEVFSFLICALLVRWINTKSFWIVIAAFFASFLVRWQLAMFVVLVFLSFSSFNLLRRRRLLYVCLLLLVVSFLYYRLGYLFENVNAVASVGSLYNEGTGLYSLFNYLQSKGFYFLVFLPKTLHAMFGLIPNLSVILNPVNIYNDVVITINALVSFFVFILVFLKGKLVLKNDYVFVAVLYCVIFTLSPIYSPRYFYPVFIFLAVALSNRLPHHVVMRLKK